VKDFVLVTASPGAEKPNANDGLRDPYIWHKLHSLSGIVPIGIFLVQHLIANSYALRGPRAYNTVISVFSYLPFVAVMEIVIIYIPILFHSIYGFWIAAYGRPNMGSYSYTRNWMYFLQRVSGVIAFFYIGFHIWNTSLQKYILEWSGDPHPERAVGYTALTSQMANDWMFAAYLIGITATVFHFSNGIWNFCIRWGLTISAQSQKMTAYVCVGVFIVLSGTGIWTACSLRSAFIPPPAVVFMNSHRTSMNTTPRQHTYLASVKESSQVIGKAI
jgi:succinate dehydrogenase / fumarate reductase, cytochrome b subunit